jgi:hypothetical protein
MLGGIDRVARLQTIAAVVLGLALIAIPLYLWRRPRSESPPVTSAVVGSAPGSPFGDAGLPDAAGSASAEPSVQLSDAKVLECHDTGSKRTRPEDCDHLAAVEKGLATAIGASATCLGGTGPGGVGGTLTYVVDASFLRKHHPLELSVPRDGRQIKGLHGAQVGQAVSGCASIVRKSMESVALDGVPHAHARYKVAITATYAAPPAAGTP